MKFWIIYIGVVVLFLVVWHAIFFHLWKQTKIKIEEIEKRRREM